MCKNTEVERDRIMKHILLLANDCEENGAAAQKRNKPTFTAQ